MRYFRHINLWKIMKSYENIIDKKELKKDIVNMLELENRVNKKHTKVYDEFVSDELYYLFTNKLDYIKEEQLILKDKKQSKFEKKVAFEKLKEYREYLKRLNLNLKKYNEILELYIISRKNPNWAYKILDKDEFNPLLDMNSSLMLFLSSYKKDKLDLYKKVILELKNTIHQLDIEN